ncbi:Sec-independent protein translocase protein TatB [Advenella alkanexedens]|jgi:sec-independent protein translocase protein TatB|uniref:Sec-independent protein translocase protein TatB n=1 Tax=Advenella alkanexedens TaxID=1481665 RepID=A0ABS6NS07_9BURK|nr:MULTISPECIES: Sec-independent protein translocase protein TatB [Advenella]MBV4398149.1 Sec-independent protein translocase protein TatB [Advenella alkanexedens]NLN68685.1 twin-arginine translocase subunit TatB [Alcaligenaceae bacterium]
MFGLSFGELFVIGMVALIVIGPERLPKVARTVGHLVGRAQRYVNDVKSDIQREVDIQEISKIKNEMQSSLQDMKSSFEDTAKSLRNPVEQLEQELTSAGDQVRQTLSPEKKDAPAENQFVNDGHKPDNKNGSGTQV